MLKPAKLYEKRLNELSTQSILNPRMKFWHGQYPDTTITIDDSFWTKIQFVSIDKRDDVRGYFKATIARPENYINGMACVNFGKPSMVFANDLVSFMQYLAYEINMPKITWNVTRGNPIEKQYDELCKKIGGRIVGIERYAVLINGKYHDNKIYEWINDYHECTHCGHRVKQEQEVMCWECGLGEMIYHNPFRR